MTKDQGSRLTDDSSRCEVSVPTFDINTTPTVLPTKPKSVVGPKAGPAIYSAPKRRLSESGYAKKAAMRVAARVAFNEAPTLSAFKDEPHEQSGFGD
jgi:hypothetical protein